MDSNDRLGGSRTGGDPTATVLTIAGFCEKYRMSRQSFYNLAAIGRAPETLDIGRTKRITPDAEARWVDRMHREPIRTGILRSAKTAA